MLWMYNNDHINVAYFSYCKLTVASQLTFQNNKSTFFQLEITHIARCTDRIPFECIPNLISSDDMNYFNIFENHRSKNLYDCLSIKTTAIGHLDVLFGRFTDTHDKILMTVIN